MSDTKAASGWFDLTRDWLKRDPITALLCLTIVATLVYFFGFIHLFVKGTFISGNCSVAAWAWQAWNPQMNQEHSRLVPFISLGLVWYHREKIRRAPKQGSSRGLVFVAIGIFLFVLSARCLQPRFALASVPFLIYGSVFYVWGPAVARIILFPCAFLMFMVPLGFLTQATAKLQLLETAAASAICNLIGIHVSAAGAVLNATDNTFHFTIDEGCSGIRSLMAIAMISAVYGHFTQDRLWKKVSIFGAALLFAIIGNAGRLVSIVIVARFFGQDLAGGPYHIISGYLSFPFALAAMWLFGMLLNIQPSRLKKAAHVKDSVSYDY